MIIQGKFQLQEHTVICSQPGYKYHKFVFRPHYDTSIPEDRRFAMATPTGELTMHVDNPVVVDAWTGKEGKYFYLSLDELPE